MSLISVSLSAKKGNEDIVNVTCGTPFPFSPFNTKKLGGSINTSFFPNLTSFSCVNNGINYFYGTGSQKLSSITLSQNNIKQQLNTLLANNSGVNSFICNDNPRLWGGFSTLGNFTNLQTLRTFRCSLTGTIPDIKTVAPQMINFHCGGNNNLIGNIPQLTYTSNSFVSLNDSTNNGKTLAMADIGFIHVGTGIISECANFSGDGSYLKTGSNFFPLGGGKTYAGWVKFNQTSNGYQFVFMQGGTTDYQSVNPLYLESNGTVSSIFTTDNNAGWTNVLWTNIVPDANVWNHFATTFDGSVARLYWNGSLVTTSEYNGSIPTPDRNFLSLGAYPAFGSYGALNGSIDEVGIWDRALNSTEISDLYNSGSAISYGSANFPSGASAYWSLNAKMINILKYFYCHSYDNNGNLTGDLSNAQPYDGLGIYYPGNGIFDISSGDQGSGATVYNCMGEFWCYGNNITGHLPYWDNSYYWYNGNTGPWVTPTLHFPNLSSFNVANNQIEGGIPEFLYARNMGLFNVDNNLLTGGLPSFSNIPNITRFTCFNNSLDGTIPSDINSCTQLNYFHCGRNTFSDLFPFVYNTKLTDLYFHNNSFTGMGYYLDISYPENNTLYKFINIPPTLKNIQGYNNSFTLEGLDSALKGISRCYYYNEDPLSYEPYPGPGTINFSGSNMPSSTGVGPINDSIRASVQALRDAGWTVTLGSKRIDG